MITERQFQTVLKGGIPFTIHMNDGRTYVTDPSRVTLGNNSLIVVDGEGTPHFIAIPKVHTVTFERPKQ